MPSTVAAVVCFAILALAGVAHARDIRGFHVAIRAHAVWPAALTLPLAVLIAVLEAAVGIAGLASVALTIEALQPLLAGAAAAIYAGFTAYGAYLVRKRPGVPCACSSDAHPIDAAVTVRALALAGLAVVAAVAAPVGVGLAAREVAVIVMASGVYAFALWTLPAALGDPFAPIRAGA